MYKKILIYLFYTLFLFISESAHAKNLKLATWNVEWLVSQKDIEVTPIPHDVLLRQPSDFQALLQYNNKLNADIVALQEVGSIETLNSIFPKNQYLFFISNDPIAQHPALAIRKNIFDHIQQNPDLTELSHTAFSRPLRSGLDVTVYTQHDSIRILVVHLKSGCQDYPLDRQQLKKSCLLLKEQQPILQEWIKKRLEEKQAFIILGDFNRVVSPNEFFFKELSTKTSLTIPTAYKANPCWNGNYFIDGFLLDPITTQWLIPNSLRVMKYKEQDFDQQNKLSDHCPVSIRLSIPDK